MIKKWKKKYFKDMRVGDPSVDRRSGEERRQVYDTDYWESEGIERRSAKDRRQETSAEAVMLG